MKYKTLAGLIADTETMPDSNLLATFASMKAIRLVYMHIAKEDKKFAKAFQVCDELVSDLKTEIKKRQLGGTRQKK